MTLDSDLLTCNTFCLTTCMLSAYPGCKRRQQWDVLLLSELMATSWWHLGHSQHFSCHQPDTNGFTLWWEIHLKKMSIHCNNLQIWLLCWLHILKRCPYINWITFIMFQCCFHILFNSNQIISNNEFLVFSSLKLNWKLSTCFVNYLTACLIWQI